MIKAIALDPGVTTGFATGLIDDGLMKVITGQAKWDHKTMWLSLELAKPDILICESFEFRRLARDNLILFSKELIGVATLYSQMHDIPLHMQTAGQGKGHFSDDKLKGSRVYKPARPHANDAVRHLLQWFVFGSGFQYNTRGYESGA